MIDFLLEPLRYPFMIRGIIAAVLVGIVCAHVGTFVVLRGLAFYGSALAHAVLPGVAIGYLLGGNDHRRVFWWGLLAAILAALGVHVITRGTRVREDTAIGIMFPVMFALGIAIISTVRDFTVDLTHFLFGNVLAVGSSDLILTAIFGGIVLITIFALFKEFVLVSFDPTQARTMRLPAGILDFILTLMIAVTIIVSLQTVGIALMAAMLVIPSAAAHLVTRRLPSMIIVSSVIAAGSGVGGLYLSFYIGIASGPAIVLVTSVVFLGAWLISRLRTHETDAPRPVNH